jgi:hypothetical protein
MIQKIFDFLGIDRLQVTGTHRKILSNKFEDVIENYEEIKTGLMDTRFGVYLDE